MSHFAGTAAVVTLALTAACGGGVDSTQDTGASGGAGGATSTTTTTTTTTATTTTTSTSSSTSTSTSTTTTTKPIVCTPSNGDTILAIDELFFGDTDPDGTANPNAWMQYGFNIDGLTSTAASTDLCQPSGKKSDVYPDGNAGIDNSFGKIIVPQLAAFLPNISSSVSGQIASGTFTLMIDFEALGAGADQATLAAKLYAGADLGGAPKFDGSDCWPVRPELLTNATDITSSKIVFPSGSLVANTWQSGVATDLTLAFPTPAGNISLTIHKAQLSLQLDADHKGGVLGQVGGVLDTAEFLAEIKKVVGNVAPIACGFVDGLIGGASDILNDGTQDPAKSCNGISIGLGFKAKIVQLGGIADPTQPGTGGCP